MWLGEPQVAHIVFESLRYFDGERYVVDAYTIMPNHVHMVFTPLPNAAGEYHSIASILHSIKRYTARESNRLLQRIGEFWQHESYDHFVRDDSEKLRIIRYVINNPVKAGLVQSWEDWKWTYCRASL